MTPRFVEVADRVYVLTEPLLDVNVTLVVGDSAALLVDTLSTAGQAAELAAAARAVTAAPWTIVNTHHHFDHCFGNAVLAADPPRPVHAHERVTAALRDHPDRLRREAYAEVVAHWPALAPGLAATALLAPPTPSAPRPCWTWAAGGCCCAIRDRGTPTATSSCTCRTPTCWSPGTWSSRAGRPTSPTPTR